MGMEPDVRAFLIRIVNSLAMALLWMLVNMIIGIKYELAFFDVAPTWKNYVYYAFALGTLVLLIWYLRRKWKV